MISFMRCGVASVTVLAVCASAPAAVLYVDGTAAADGDGAAWTSAYDDLHVALAAAGPGDEIWMAAGTYRASDLGIRGASFWLADGVAVYGGFAGDETERAQRDWTTHETILTGDLAGDDGPVFENIGENSLHVVRAAGVTATLDGFIVTGGNADQAGVWDDRGGGLLANGGGTVTIVHCTFRSNVAWDAGTDGRGAGVCAFGTNAVVTRCVFESNVAGGSGGGVYVRETATAFVADCTFTGNSADVGGGLDVANVGQVTVGNCAFTGNLASAGGGGAIIALMDDAFVIGCTFSDNAAGITSGGLGIGSGASEVRNCSFTGNTGGTSAGGVGCSGPSSFVNCEFAQNAASTGGGALAVFAVSFVNCTFAGNAGGGITTESNSDLDVRNSILWNNTPAQVVEHPQSPGGAIAIWTSDVGGGWNGAGASNIDADPLFVQPGLGDLRLSFGSPCLDAGDDAAVPPGVTTDLAGADRFQGAAVDMGAYEGGFEPGPQMATTDLDPGESGELVPSGNVFDPMNHPGVIASNISGAPGSAIFVLLHDEDPHPGAGGFSSNGAVLEIDGTVPDGAFRAFVVQPFDLDMLDGADPLAVDITRWSAETGTWALAVAANTQAGPGASDVIGERNVVVGAGAWGVAFDLGTYGVFWNPHQSRGFAWANVDRTGQFGVGVPTCVADCAQPPDGNVGMLDLARLLNAWGGGHGPYDTDNDGNVGLGDLETVLGGWGGCAGP